MLYRFFTLLISAFFFIVNHSSAQDNSKYGIDITSNSELQVVKIGMMAPGFNAEGQNGDQVNLENMLEEGPVVLVFYRGEWCGYCNRALAEYESELISLKNAGAQIIAVTPESSENRELTIEKSNISFPIIIDEDLSIMKNYGVAFKVTDDYQNKLFNFTGKHITDMNFMTEAVLPIPATYIIGQDKKVKWSHFDPDYSKRASIDEILEEISKL